jgi:hypothetical protein
MSEAKSCEKRVERELRQRTGEKVTRGFSVRRSCRHSTAAPAGGELNYFRSVATPASRIAVAAG